MMKKNTGKPIYHVDETIDTGIYVTTPKTVMNKEAFHESGQVVVNSYNLEKILTSLEKSFREILQDHGHDSETKLPGKNKPPIVRDAVLALSDLKELRKFVKGRSKVVTNAVVFGYRFGRAVEKIHVRHAEPDALRGKEQRKHLSRNRTGRSEKAAARMKLIKDEVDSLMRDNPSVSLHAAQIKVAKKHEHDEEKGFGLRTITEVTKGRKRPSPKKSKK